MLLKNSLRIVSFLVTLSVCNSIIAQSNLNIELQWGEDERVLTADGISTTVPNLENFIFEGENSKWHKVLDKTNNNKWLAIVENYSVSDANSYDLKYIETNNVNVQNSFNLDSRNISASGIPKLSISFIPYIYVNGSVKRITSVDLLIDEDRSTPLNLAKRDFVTSSVLGSGSGDWYKISVTQDGIYKIDRNFLESCGIDVATVNPQDINIYGNGFGQLPENNSVDRPDDLVKNSIYISGETDGSFDGNDFILFYGRGPNAWRDKGAYGFEREMNIYSTVSCYYINVNSSDPAQRIENADLTTAAATNTVTDYNSFSRHEIDAVNILKGGQRWYGEEYDATVSRNIAFSIPNLNTASPITLKAFIAYKNGGGSANFQLAYNGGVFSNTSLSSNSADYRRQQLTYNPGDLNPSSGSFSINTKFNKSVASDVAYLDFIEINARSFLTMSGTQMEFRDKLSVGTGNIAEFEVSGYSASNNMWEITDYNNPKLVNGTLNSGTYRFKVAADSVRSFIAFTGTSYLSPSFVERVEQQNLHSLDFADYLIVTHPSLISQANRLADLHRNFNDLSVHVVTTEQIFNEFSSGTNDATAIRYFAKMFYDRANGNTALMPKYLCLFGDGTYDPKGRVANNNYLVPVYEVVTSENHISNTVSDDYFGMLDDSESFLASDLMDIGVGRLLASDVQMAKEIVDKIEHYMKNGSNIYANTDGLTCDDDGFASSQGDWRSTSVSIADDEEGGYFVNSDCEPAYNYVTNNHPEINTQKIYLDAFTQISTAGGQRYPDAVERINQSIDNGAVLMNYVGHGGESGVALERVITIPQILAWRNINRLPLFVSATCEFTKYDDNERVSAGEIMSFTPFGGAIALMTTTRSVYFSTNSNTVAAFYRHVFQRDADLEPLSFGEIIKNSKNQVVMNGGGDNNMRSFTLIGDPALKIALPKYTVVTDSINGFEPAIYQDTMKALGRTQVYGHIEDEFGNLISNYDGILQPSIFDKPQQKSTLGQDVDSPVIAFEEQRNVLFRGKVSITNGLFNYEFIVPKDIDYSYGFGKMSYYGYNEEQFGTGGSEKRFYIGGVDTTGLSDDVGPDIEIFLNDDSFVNGGITNEKPIFIANVFDENGINTVGNGVGHDITLILDDKTADMVILNEYYEADLDTYQSGKVRYPISNLEPGLHTLTFKVWDVNNNSSEAVVEFRVQESVEMELDHVLNYPNPFSTRTEFFFEHNQVCTSLEAQIQIFTVSGRLVKTINETVHTEGFRTEGIMWDGRDDFGDNLGRGVYVYRVKVTNPDGDVTEAIEKLFLLN